MSGLFDERELTGWPVIPANPTIEQAKRCADEVARWMKTNLPPDVWRLIPGSVASEQSVTVDDLATVIRWWNQMHADSLVFAGVREKPAKHVLEAWKAFERNETSRELMADLDAVRREIELSTFCRESWFCLEKLLRGSKNGGGVPIIQMLMQGGYRDKKSGLLDTLASYSSE